VEINPKQRETVDKKGDKLKMKEEQKLKEREKKKRKSAGAADPEGTKTKPRNERLVSKEDKRGFKYTDLPCDTEWHWFHEAGKYTSPNRGNEQRSQGTCCECNMVASGIFCR